MGVRVYYSEISGSKEVKKRQQRVMMILDSKSIPYEAIDITEPGKESAKDFMLSNAKPRGDSKIILSPQIFSDDLYCGDYDDFDLANENDVLEEFLNSPKIEKNVPAAKPASTTQNNENNVTTSNGNAASRESSVEAGANNNESNDNENNEAEQQQTDNEQVSSSEVPTEIASAADPGVDSTTSNDEAKEGEGNVEEQEEVDE